MALADLVPEQVAFRTSAEFADAFDLTVLGESEEGRPIMAAVLGDGPVAVSLVAGAHADEPVGPETLRTFVERAPAELLARFRFVVVPHINPDGEARNRAWIERWPDLLAYRDLVQRELPGRDLEFGYPDMRVENRLVAEFLRAHAPFALHMSLHGMGVSEGAMLLIERHWIDRTARLREGFVEAARRAGLGLHDHDRKGEKGFFYIGPGFTTTPEGAAMREHFKDEPDTAAKFHESSMEFVRSLGGDPLCLVTELPLFVVRNDDPQPGVPAAYLAARAGRTDLEFTPFDLRASMRLQMRTIELGLEACTDSPSGAH